ncbi:MAG TPA: hypothetical protein VHS96_12020 [Bacteroidia bacterium]|nr:hypothetical protein [Bacteroidia bacterium]
MNKNFFFGLIAGLVLLVIFAFRPVGEKPVTEGIQKWEYKIFVSYSDPSKREGSINLLGKDGWELVAFDGAMVFKRPIQ